VLIPAGPLGNFAPGEIVDFKVHTRRDDTFAPATLAGSPAFAVYKGGSLVEDATGLTASIDFDGRTGLIHIQIDTSQDPAFFTTGHFQVVCTAGTVNSVPHEGAVAATFVLDGQAELLAAVAGAVTLIKEVTDLFSFEGDRVAAVLAAADHTAFATALQDLTDGVEAGLTRRQLDRIVFAALSGLVSGMAQPVPPGPVLFKNKAGNKNRITATLDGSGNRLSVSFDLS
jgi:hypothetical protein